MGTENVNHHNSTLLVWIRAIIIALPCLSAGYNIGIVNTLNTQIPINFDWDDSNESKLSFKFMQLLHIFSFKYVFGDWYAFFGRSFWSISSY